MANESHNCFPLLQQHMNCRIWRILQLERYVFRPLRNAFRELKIVVQEQVGHDHFDLETGKEPTGARMLTVAPR